MNASQKAARVAGFTFPLATAIVVIVNYGINIVCNLIYVANIVVLFAALYVVLKPVNLNLAMLAALFRLVFALTWGITALNTLGALRLLGDAANQGSRRANG
jgi:hypothetical protein